MTVLVTGGAGYIGSHMVLELLEAGEKVVVLDNLSTGRRSAVPPEAELIVGDFGDEALVNDLLASRNVDAIIHFAAKIVVPNSVADPLGYYFNNTASARSLLACAVAQKVGHFISPPPPPSMATRSKPGHRGRKPEARLALWPLQADGRMDAGGAIGRVCAAGELYPWL